MSDLKGKYVGTDGANIAGLNTQEYGLTIVIWYSL